MARRAFAGDTGEELVAGGGRLVAFADAGTAAADPGLQQFLLRVVAAAAVLLLVLSAWMRSVRLPDGGSMSATEQGATVEELLEEADALNAAEAEADAARPALQRPGAEDAQR